MVRTFCSLFGHRRDSRRAYLSSGNWRAPCRWCGERLRRVSPGNWTIVGDERPLVWPAWTDEAAAHPFTDRSGANAPGGARQGKRDGSAGPDADRRRSSEGIGRNPRLAGALFQWRAADGFGKAEIIAVAFASGREIHSCLEDQVHGDAARPAGREHFRSIAANDGASD